MPWEEVTRMSQKREFIRLAEISDSLSDVCRGFGISRKTGYKWLDRYRTLGLLGLEERSRRPHHFPTETGEEIRPSFGEMDGSNLKGTFTEDRCAGLNTRSPTTFGRWTSRGPFELRLSRAIR